jgi:putative Holliday junction resolvase
MNLATPKMIHAQTVLGFDFGMRKIGVAVGQTVTKTANPLTQLKAENGEPTWEQIAALIKQWNPFALIVGRPLNMDGTTQPITFAAEEFAKMLASRYTLPVHLVDERLSTVAARSQLFEKGGYRTLSKKNIDETAAQIILQEWLNSNDF